MRKTTENSMNERTTITFEDAGTKAAPFIVRLRWLLKFALRMFGLRCVSITEAGDKLSATEIPIDRTTGDEISTCRLLATDSKSIAAEMMRLDTRPLKSAEAVGICPAPTPKFKSKTQISPSLKGDRGNE
jgi:hypothetical protein